MEEIIVRKVETLQDLWRVYQLVNQVYNMSGIAERSSSGLMIHHPDQDVVPQSYIFLAEINHKIVGTIIYTIDNQFGLMVDDDFKFEIEFYRLIYSQISSVWRFAVLPEYQHNLNIMKKLIGVAFWHMKKLEIPVCFLTISPEHARIYKKIMGMEEVAKGKDSNPLIKPEHADIILLKAYAEKIPDKWLAEYNTHQLAC